VTASSKRVLFIVLTLVSIVEIAAWLLIAVTES